MHDAQTPRPIVLWTASWLIDRSSHGAKAFESKVEKNLRLDASAVGWRDGALAAFRQKDRWVERRPWVYSVEKLPGNSARFIYVDGSRF
jgi:hypothetical protein